MLRGVLFLLVGWCSSKGKPLLIASEKKFHDMNYTKRLQSSSKAKKWHLCCVRSLCLWLSCWLTIFEKKPLKDASFDCFSEGLMSRRYLYLRKLVLPWTQYPSNVGWIFRKLSLKETNRSCICRKTAVSLFPPCVNRDVCTLWR